MRCGSTVGEGIDDEIDKLSGPNVQILGRKLLFLCGSAELTLAGRQRNRLKALPQIWRRPSLQVPVETTFFHTMFD